jgi:hypothetical protein
LEDAGVVVADVVLAGADEVGALVVGAFVVGALVAGAWVVVVVFSPQALRTVIAISKITIRMVTFFISPPYLNNILI